MTNVLAAVAYLLIRLLRSNISVYFDACFCPPAEVKIQYSLYF